MAIEPQVFICYGRPDKDVAQAFACEFWNLEIECYNYLAKPVEDRLGAELDHLGYLAACRLFVALLSPESSTRYLVVEELALAAEHARLPERLCRCRAYILTTTSPLAGSFPDPDLLFTADELGDIPRLVRKLTSYLGTEFTDRARRAWNANKELYPDAWAALDALYASAPQSPSPPFFTPGRHSIFGDEREPTLAELKALGPSRLKRLWQDVAKRRDQHRRRYGEGESFLLWSLQRDRELIEAALRELETDGGKCG
jgi:hypothetical protein